MNFIVNSHFRRLRRIKHDYRYAAERRSPAEWIKQINALPERHRAIVARVVWWDWFGDRTCWNRVAEFDHWLYEPLCPIADEPPPEALMKSIVSIGYPMEIAQRRFRRKLNATSLHQIKNPKATDHDTTQSASTIERTELNSKT